MSQLGPVSQAAAEEVRELARQNGIVVWLDSDNRYAELVDELERQHAAGSFPYPVVAYRGSYLETMVALDGLIDGPTMVPLILHAPFHNEDLIRETPLLEAYRAGQRYRKKFSTLVEEASHERATPEDVEAFLDGGEVTLAEADAWLSNYSKVGDWLGPDLSTHGAQSLFNELMPGGTLAAKIDDPDIVDAVWERAAQLVGARPDFRPAELRAQGLRGAGLAASVCTELAAFCMCTEFVDDLKRPPVEEWLVPLTKLSKPFRVAAGKLAAFIRVTHPESYARWADEVEGTMKLECETATADDLGKVDTFRFEDKRILDAAVDALHSDSYDQARSWARLRSEVGSFWTQRDRVRRLAWQVIDLAAQLGEATEAHARLVTGCATLGEAAQAYAGGGHLVDRHHRKLEQEWDHALPELGPLDRLSRLRSAIEHMRGVYRGWLDHESEAFTTLCESQGFLPSADLQQRSLFQQVVQPWATDEAPTAYFLVDAMRYEMGAQLAEEMRQAGTAEVSIAPRMAELPTNTVVGMNILAPVAVDERLRPEFYKGKFKGFRSGTLLVCSPDTRTRAMHQAVGGDTCPSKSLEEIGSMDMSNLKRSIARSRLVVVHCEGIDKAGEKGVGLGVFEPELRRLRSAWTRLHEAGIRRFVFTADHGFLLHDVTTRNPVTHGNKTYPDRRHILTDMAGVGPEETHVSTRSLGYEGSENYLLFPRSGALYNLGERAKNFNHGGNSLQERIIPVVTVEHRHQAGKEMTRYQFEAHVVEQSGNLHRLQVRIQPDKGQVSLSFATRKRLEVALECVGSHSGQVELLEVSGGERRGNAIFAPIDSPFDVSFRVLSSTGKRVRLRLTHATGLDSLDPLELREWFDSGVLRHQTDREAVPTPPPAPTPAGDSWLDSFEDEGFRRVFAHLAEYGTLSESEASDMLGGARKYRRFRRQLDGHRAHLPFKIRSESTGAGTTYVREEEG